MSPEFPAKGDSAVIHVDGIDTADDYVKIFDAVRSTGAMKGTLYTGKVLNKHLLEMYERAVRTGAMHLGGTVTKLGPDSFRVDFTVFPVFFDFRVSTMSSADELPLESETLRVLCRQLNLAHRESHAHCSVDTFSGGFKFSDEVPGPLKASDELRRPLITLMRRLWGYRASLVAGDPRKDLAPYWELVRELAPEWAGFTADRCSAKMKPSVDAALAQSMRLVQELEALQPVETANGRKTRPKPRSLAEGG